MSQKRFLNIISITAVVSIIVSGGHFILLQTSIAFAEAQVQQTTQQIDTSDWKTYRNKDFGFKVQYPKEWVIHTGTDNITGKIVSVSLDQPYQSDDKKAPSASVQFFIQRGANPTRSSIQQWINAKQQSKIKWVQTIIGGKSAVVRETTSEAFGEHKEFFISVNGTDILTISYFPQAQFDQIYETIISTIEFLD